MELVGRRPQAREEHIEEEEHAREADGNRAEEQLADVSGQGQSDTALLKAKIATAHFYAEHILSTLPGLRDAIIDGADSVGALAVESF